MKTASVFCGVAFIAAALTGCSKEGPDMGQVTGHVTRDNKPVAGATVYFQPEVGRRSQGLTEADGSYKLRYTHTEDGAKVGKHKVFIGFVPPAGPEAEIALAKGKIKPAADQKAILDKYGITGSAVFEKEVRGGSQVIDLKLD